MSDLFWMPGGSPERTIHYWRYYHTVAAFIHTHCSRFRISSFSHLRLPVSPSQRDCAMSYLTGELGSWGGIMGTEAIRMTY